MFSILKHRQLWRNTLFLILDFISIFFGVWVVYLIRYSWFRDNTIFFTPTGKPQIPYLDYILISLFLAFIVVLLYSFLGVYTINSRKNVWYLLFQLGLGILVVLLTLITFFFFNEYNRNTLPTGVPISRFILGAGGFFAFYFVILSRASIWAVEQILYWFNIGRINIAIIGDKNSFLKEEYIKLNYIDKVFEYEILNSETFQDLENKIIAKEISEIYLLNTYSQFDKKLALLSERHKISFIFSPEGFADFHAFGLKPVIIKKKVFLELLYSNLEGWYIVLKRLFDFVFALFFLILTSPLFLVISILIKLDSPGPVFYLSERVAANGKVFKIWKFRRLKAEFCTSESDPKTLEIEQKLIEQRDIRKDGVLYKIENDPRSTKIGRWLEKTSLDEIPQFINVLFGDLSLVGPRPHQPREVAKYKNHHFKVLNIKPGLTGLAQISGRSDLNFEDEVYYDTYYVEHWSFWMDLWIIIKTPFVILFNKHRS
jgi:exopolysaccharide biosynthesis polyprenyl glycosylphosphotransferase